MTKCKAINFNKLVEELIEKQQALQEGWPVVVSGTCASDVLLDWLNDLDTTAFSVYIWCYTDACVIGRETVPTDVALLERARIFGLDGDLEIWRGGQDFRWRYVGLAAHAPKGKEWNWPVDENKPVFWRERTMLLWGNRPKGRERWHDNRVAGAALDYPVNGAPERVQVRYREYTQAGRPFAIWLRELEDYNG
jgi:hypothetical protein